MKPWIAVAAAAAAVAPAGVSVAHAGSRGGSCGGSSGGGGGSGGGHGGGSYSHGVWHAAGDCEDSSDVVGLRHCARYAAWAVRFPRLVIEAGAMVRRFPSLLDDQRGSVSHGAESFAYRVVQTAPRRALDTAILSTMRASLSLSGALYGGLEVDLGGVAQPGQAKAEMMSTGTFGSPRLAQDSGFIVDTLGLVGLRSALGFGGVAVELAGGVRTVSYSFHSDYHDCVSSTTVSAVAPVGDARARGELWLGPWLTAGVAVGTSLLERRNWSGALYLGIHSRAFGGDR